MIFGSEIYFSFCLMLSSFAMVKPKLNKPQNLWQNHDIEKALHEIRKNTCLSNQLQETLGCWM